MLKAFYLELRKKAVASEGGVPITTRQLESLVRLAEARARADLRQVRSADTAAALHAVLASLSTPGALLRVCQIWLT